MPRKKQIEQTFYIHRSLKERSDSNVPVVVPYLSDACGISTTRCSTLPEAVDRRHRFSWRIAKKNEMIRA